MVFSCCVTNVEKQKCFVVFLCQSYVFVGLLCHGSSYVFLGLLCHGNSLVFLVLLCHKTAVGFVVFYSHCL